MKTRDTRTWLRKLSFIFLGILSLTVLAFQARGQDDRNKMALLLKQTGTRTSPFDPGEPSDTRFIVDDASGLDTGCTFRGGGPLIFDIEVTRFVGLVNSNGTLQDPAALIANGIVSPTATLKMPAFDVDFDAVLPSPFDPERDRVLFNGVDLGFLTGLNNTWIPNTFVIPIKHVKFPAENSTTSAKNTITIEIDVANEDIGRQLWCTAIDWAELSFQAVRPVLLAHGILSEEDTWSPIWTQGLSNQNIPHETIQLGIAGIALSSIQENSAKIANKVASMRSQFGVDKINIVGHSKGGLDSRDYIHTHNDIEQLIMIATPNAGSPVADFVQGLIVLSGVPNTILAAFAAPAGYQLTTVYMKNYFNPVVGQNRNTRYIALAGNHDPNGGFLGLGPDGAWYLLGRDDWVVQVSSVYALGYTQNLIPFRTDDPNVDSKHWRQLRSQALFNMLVGNLNQFGASSRLMIAAAHPSFEFRTASFIQARDAPLLAAADGKVSFPGQTFVRHPGQRRYQLPVLSMTSATTLATPSLQRTASEIDFIQQAEVQTHTVRIGQASQAFFQCTWGEGDLDLVIIDPNGTRIDPTVAQIGSPIEHQILDDVEGLKFEGYTVLQNPLPGTWTLEVTAVNVGSSGEHYAIGAFLEGADISLETVTDKEFYRKVSTLK